MYWFSKVVLRNGINKDLGFLNPVDNMLRKFFIAFIKSVWLSLFFRLIVGIVFIYAGITKFNSAGEFAHTIQNYQLLPLMFTNLIAIFLPWLEIYCGVFLLIGFFPRSSAVILTFLNSVFIIALLSAYMRDLDIDCGCFGQSTKVDSSKIIADIFLFLFCVHLIKYPAERFTLNSLFKRLP